MSFWNLDLLINLVNAAVCMGSRYMAFALFRMNTELDNCQTGWTVANR